MTVTPEQLAKINSFGSAGLPPYEANDLTAISFIATNNLIGRNQGKWSINTLKQIANLLPGISQTCNHDWYEIEDIQGVIFEATVFKSETAPSRLIDIGGNGAINRQIIDQEGFAACLYKAALPSSNMVLSGLRLGSISKVSIGGFCGASYICPLCNVAFEDPDCPHYMPWDAQDAADKRYAPYFLRDGAWDLGEVSLVLIPNIPGAGIITREDADFYNYT